MQGHNVDPQEWEVRCDLAAAYRLIAYYGMDDLIFTHLSARLPGEGHRFLLNPYGQMFDEITASSLVAVDPEGHALEEDEQAKINSAGFTIHSAVHMSRPDAMCVMHTHTTAGMAVAAQEQGLLPLSQTSMQFHGRVTYHDYEGIALDLDERDRLVNDLGESNAMILRHHGLLTAGPHRRRGVPQHVLPRAILPPAGRRNAGRAKGRAAVGRGGPTYRRTVRPLRRLADACRASLGRR